MSPPQTFRGNAMTTCTEVIHPAIYELVALGRGVGGTKISASTRAQISQNLDNAFSRARERSKSHANATSPQLKR
jgi:hypothetical protein